MYSGEGKRQPECQRQSKPSQAEEGQEEEGGGWGGMQIEGARLLLRPSLFLAPTLICDGGDDAAAAAAALAVRPAPSVLTGCRVLGSVAVVVVLGVVGRTDGEAQLCVT